MALKAIFNAFGVTYDDGEGARLLRKEVTLIDAEIKALFHPTAVALIASPGAGKRIALLRADVDCYFDSGLYTNINANSAYMSIRTGAGGEDVTSYLANDNTTTPALTELSSVFGSAKRHLIVYPPLLSFDYVFPSWSVLPFTYNDIGGTMVDKGLELYGVNTTNLDLTGGHANNRMRVSLLYTIETLP